MAKRKRVVAKSKGVVAESERLLSSVWGLIVWLVGILVSLAVGSGMTAGILTVMYVPDVVTMAAGWIVVILTILGVVLKIIDLFTE